MATRVQELRRENLELRERLSHLKSQSLNANKIDSEINKFIQESEKNVEAMSEQVRDKGQKQTTQIHEQTGQYEALLQKQIKLLTLNK